MSEETVSYLKAVQNVLTDTSFSLDDYATQIESLIEKDADLAGLAKTSFILVNEDAFKSLEDSVTSEANDLMTSTETQSGLIEDIVT